MPRSPHGRISTKFCTAVEIVDVITCAKFCSNWFRDVDSVCGRIEYVGFPLTKPTAVNNLTQCCATAPPCDIFFWLLSVDELGQLRTSRRRPAFGSVRRHRVDVVARRDTEPTTRASRRQLADKQATIVGRSVVGNTFRRWTWPTVVNICATTVNCRSHSASSFVQRDRRLDVTQCVARSICVS